MALLLEAVIIHHLIYQFLHQILVRRVKKFLKEWKNVAMYISLLKVKGTGKINKLPFLDFPLITYKYHEEDLQLIKKSLRKMLELFFTIDAKEILIPLKINL